MDWEKTHRRLKRLVGRELRSISGKADIKLIDVTPRHYVVLTPRGPKKRRIEELRKIVEAMSLDKPVHVESTVFGSNSSRNHPETVLAALPDVEWLKVDGRKHIVWRGTDSHKLGTLRKSHSQ